MHVFRSMNRKEITTTIGLWLLVCVMLCCGFWLVLGYGDIDYRIAGSSSSESEGTEETEGQQTPMASAPPSEIQPSQEADVLIISLAQFLGISVQEIIGAYCFIAILLSIGLIVFWYRCVYMPVRCTCVFVYQTTQLDPDEEGYVCVLPPLAHPAHSSHHPHKKSHSR